jgi:uncharacterized protein YjbJ (UPF0337 family)
MGISDKISGRAKQAAGDLTGSEALRREGAQEERKHEAKEELATAEARAQRKAEEVEELERRTDSDQLEADRSKEELYEEAQELGVEGRSDMNKDELADEVRRHK